MLLERVGRLQPRCRRAPLEIPISGPWSFRTPGPKIGTRREGGPAPLRAIRITSTGIRKRPIAQL